MQKSLSYPAVHRQTCQKDMIAHNKAVGDV